MRIRRLAAGAALALALLIGLAVAEPAYAREAVGTTSTEVLSSTPGGSGGSASDVLGTVTAPSGCIGLSGDCDLVSVIRQMDLPNDIKTHSSPIQNELSAIYRMLRSMVVAFAGLALVWAGVLYLTSGTNRAEREQATELIQRTVTGVLIIGLIPLFFSVFADMRLVSNSMVMDNRPRVLLSNVRIAIGQWGTSPSIPYKYWNALRQTVAGVDFSEWKTVHNAPAGLVVQGNVTRTNVTGPVWVRGDILVKTDSGSYWQPGGFFSEMQVAGDSFRVELGESEVKAILGGTAHADRVADAIQKGEALPDGADLRTVRVIAYTPAPGGWANILGERVPGRSSGQGDDQLYLTSQFVFHPEYTPEMPVEKRSGWSAFVFYVVSALLFVFRIIAMVVSFLTTLLIPLAFRPIYLDSLPEAALTLWVLFKNLAQIGMLLVATFWAVAYILGRKQTFTGFLQQVFLALVGINFAPFFIQRLLDLNYALVASLMNIATGGTGMEGALVWSGTLGDAAGDLLATIASTFISIAFAFSMIYICGRYIIRYLEIVFWAILSPLVFTIGAYQGMGGSAVRTMTRRVTGAIFMQAVDSVIIAIVLAFATDGLAGQFIRLAAVFLIAKSDEFARDLLGLDTSMSAGSAIGQGFARTGAMVLQNGVNPAAWARSGRDALVGNIRKSVAGQTAMQWVDDTMKKLHTRQAFRQEYEALTGTQFKPVVRLSEKEQEQISRPGVVGAWHRMRYRQRQMSTSIGEGMSRVLAPTLAVGRGLTGYRDPGGPVKLSELDGMRREYLRDARSGEFAKREEIAKLAADRTASYTPEQMEELGEKRKREAVREAMAYRDRLRHADDPDEWQKDIERAEEQRQREEKRRQEKLEERQWIEKRDEMQHRRREELVRLREQMYSQRNSETARILKEAAAQGSVRDLHVHMEQMLIRVEKAQQRKLRVKSGRVARGGAGNSPLPLRPDPAQMPASSDPNNRT